MKKVEHERKGYVRRTKDGKEIEVRATIVNKGNKKSSLEKCDVFSKKRCKVDG